MSISRNKECLPFKLNSSDLFIVEFPKSGITWLSTILANLNLLLSELPLRATYYNIQQFIPDLHMSKNVADTPTWSIPPFRFLKSHSLHCSQYNHVVYVVRNPVSVMNSYYKRAITLKQTDLSFIEFIRCPEAGIDSWVKHIESWLFRGNTAQRIHVISYESLHHDAFASIKNLYTNLGILVEDSLIGKAIELSEFRTMKSSESLYRKYNPNYTMEFIREGKAIQKDIDSDAKSYIFDKTKHLLEALNYEYIFKEFR